MKQAPHPAEAPQLTPQRLFSDPPLNVAVPTSFAFSHDGRVLTYLRVSDDDRERMDLWAYDFERDEQRLLLDARTVTNAKDVTGLTPEERAERERRRQFAYGITQYEWHPTAPSILVALDGQAFVVDVSKDPDWAPLTVPGTRQTSIRFSPAGTFVGYVRDGDLYFTPVAAGHETRVTHDAGVALSNGLADFLAAEEMDRYEGYWWSPDERMLAYCKVNETDVPESLRLEIDANGSRSVSQRYPFAGENPPTVSIHLFDRTSGDDRCIWTTSAEFPYLARLHYTDAGIYIEVQDRLQQNIRIELYTDDAWRVVHEESSRTWVNLTHDFHRIDGGFVYTSEATGTRRVLRVLDSGSVTEIAGPTHVNKIVHASAEVVFALGWDDTPIENHLFKLADDECAKVTRASGWHQIAMDKPGDRFVDHFTSDTVPVRVECGSTTDLSVTRAIFAETLADPHPYAPLLAEHAFPAFGTFASEDGQVLHYRLTPPRRVTGRHPVILFVYGGPGAQLVRKTWHAGLPQLFAAYGFGLLEVDNRGSANRGSAFEAPIFRAMGGAEVRDQVLGLEVLQRVAWADAERVGVFGHSYGGYMSLMCLARAGQSFAAGAAVAPVCDWRLYDTHYTERYLGLPTTDRAAYDESNVLHHLRNIDRPLLLMHGMADDNVLFTHTTMIMDELQKLGKPFELMTYPGAKHSMQEKHVAIHRFELLLDFFARYLGRPV